MNRNNDCGGSHCVKATGEVRVLPTGTMSNAIVCEACYDNEIRWRKGENKRLAKDFAYPLPTWESLEVYNPE